ncbi:MAG: hypothetical protein ACREO9_01370 [Lysobacterales bacterium]
MGIESSRVACLLDQILERMRCLHYSLGNEKIQPHSVNFFIRGYLPQGEVWAKHGKLLRQINLVGLNRRDAAVIYRGL